MRGAERLAHACASFGLAATVREVAGTVLVDADSVQASGEQDLATLLRVLALAGALGLGSVVATLGGRRVTVDLDDVADYLDGTIDRADLMGRWG